MEQHDAWLEKMMQHIQAELKLNKAKILLQKEPAMVPGQSHQPVRGKTGPRKGGSYLKTVTTYNCSGTEKTNRSTAV